MTTDLDLDALEYEAKNDLDVEGYRILPLIVRIRQLERVVERLRQIADITPEELAALAVKQ